VSTGLIERLCLAVIAALLCLLDLDSPAKAAFPGQNGRIAFVRPDPAVGGDNEIWTMNPDGSSQVKLTDNTSSDTTPTWSPDGKWIAFTSNRDGNNEIYVMSGSGGSPTRLTNNAASDFSPTWSPGGEQIAFSSNRDGNYEIYKMNVDGSNVLNLTMAAATDLDPAWSYDGSKIAFATSRCPGGDAIWAMNPDGSGQTQVDNGCAQDVDYYDPTWAPRDDPQYAPNQLVLGWSWNYYDVFGAEDRFYYMEFPFLAGGYFHESGNTLSEHGAWSPDGNWATLSQRDYPDHVYVVDIANYSSPQVAQGSDPDWQPVIPGYARPKSATPAAVQLVPALKACGSSNATHGTPLDAPSCSPSEQTSDYLTVGGTAGNPSAAKFHGFVDFKVLAGDTATFADEADLRIIVEMTDVRRKSDQLDYEGELEASLPLRITDRWNGPSLNQVATASDVPLSFAVPCTATPDTTIGSSCSITTTVDSIAPDTARESRRSSWELGQIQVYDGGPDGDADTTADNTLFATQGLFVP
jgi:hypothetical protein